MGMAGVFVSGLNDPPIRKELGHSPFGFLKVLFLDTKETAKEYDFEWYHDVSELQVGEPHTYLGVNLVAQNLRICR